MKALRLLVLFSILAATIIPVSTNAISVSSSSAVLYINSVDAVSDDRQVKLGMPPVSIGGSVYVPASALRSLFRWDLTVIKRNEVYIIKSPDKIIELNLVTKKYLFEGTEYDLGNLATLVKGNLHLQIRGLGDIFGLLIQYEAKTKKISVTYIPESAEEELLPVARFYTSKTDYMIGEKIEYFDVSYSPTDELLSTTEWSGKKDVFFEPGTKAIKLRVGDKSGKLSKWFTQIITVLPETMYTPFQYHIYEENIGKSMAYPTEEVRLGIVNLPKIGGIESLNNGGPLLVSNSPESVKEFGVLYSDTVKGNARLYASHVNGTSEKMMFIIMATNMGAQESRVSIMRRGEIIPSPFAQLNGRQGVLEYMIDRQGIKSSVVPSKNTIMLVKLPTLSPGKGLNVIYDIEAPSDSEIKYSFIAVPVTANIKTILSNNLLQLRQLEYNKHIRGTFEKADKRLMLNGADINEPKALPISDGVIDASTIGYDNTRKGPADNPGNYGVMYRVDIDKPPAMTVVMRARGGSFKGHFKINSRIVLAPPSGVLEPKDGLLILARTKGNENELSLEFSPPAGSALPIDIILLPHGKGGVIY